LKFDKEEKIIIAALLILGAVAGAMTVSLIRLIFMV